MKKFRLNTMQVSTCAKAFNPRKKEAILKVFNNERKQSTSLSFSPKDNQNGVQKDFDVHSQGHVFDVEQVVL